MNAYPSEKLAPMRAGLFFAILTPVYGFGLGAAFGAAEDSIKDRLHGDARGVLAARYGGDESRAGQVADKSWVYFKRAHLHANGLGAASLAMILLLSFLKGGDGQKFLVALGLGIGSLGYALYWMLAALAAPGLGSTDAAKESLSWLSIPASGLCILGLLAVLLALVRTAFPARPRGA
ncbi:MAG: hypothetical protein ACYTEZ_13780 [Planctomycetota bacterium]|jgi:hypothetical protein